MGKVTCASCNKSCKSQAVRLDNKHYHLTCFKCCLCEKSLASRGFFTKDKNRYCVDDYRRLFGTHCDYCGEYVEGEVVTAINHTYHEDCFCCSLCKRRFQPGDRVTLTGPGGKHCLCADCDVDNDDETLDVLKQAPVIRPKDDESVRAAATEETCKEIMAPLIRETLSAPVTPARQLYNIEDKDEDDAGTNTQRLDNKTKISTPNDRSKYIMSTPSGYKSDMSRSIDFLNGSYSDVRTAKERQLFSPIQNIMRYRSTSPGVSPRIGCRSVSPGAVSQKSRESTGSYNSKYNFSKFYHSSYLDIMEGQKEFKRGPSLNPGQMISVHYHRPTGSFSYTTARKDIHIAGGGNKQSLQLKKAFWQYDVVSKVDRQYISALNKLIPYQPDDTQEPIQLSKIPDAKTDEHRVAPIERADWPAPPAPAAAYPELFREYREKSLRDGSEWVNGEDKENCSGAAVTEIDRNITELTKLTDSGAAQVILSDLKRLQMAGVTLDPRSASRTPNAAVEPYFKPRYDSPVYASPSRDLDLYDRSQSLSDHLYIERKYRTTPVPQTNTSVIDCEVSAKHIVRSNRQVPRPGYSLGPACPVSSIGDYRPRSSGVEESLTSPWRPRSTIDVGSDLHVLLADGDCCPVTGLRHRVGGMGGSMYSNPNFGSNGYLGSQKPSLNLSHVVPGEGAGQQSKRVYPLEELKKEVLPQGVNKKFVERHLSKEDFVSVFGMNTDEFNRLPVWNRNDLKIRAGLNRQ